MSSLTNTAKPEGAPAGSDQIQYAHHADLPARAGDALWRALVEGVPYYVALLSVEGRILYLNHTRNGVSPESFTGRSIFQILTRAEGLIRPAFERVMSQLGPEELDFPYTQGEETRWLHVVLSAVRGLDGERVGVLLVGHDITETHQAGIELRMSVNALHRLVEAREQLAADLHDGILQSLYGIGLRIEAARAVIADPSGGAHLDQAIAEIRNSMAEMRRFIQHERSTGSSTTASWEETLGGLLRGLEVSGGPSLHLQVPSALAARVPDAVRNELIFLAREAVSNAMRHSAGTQVTVRLLEADDVLRLEIEDNGRGLDGLPNPDGFGLLTMTRRASAIGAELTVHSYPGAGTLVRFALPAKGQGK